jgi:hypothetical protein
MRTIKFFFVTSAFFLLVACERLVPESLTKSSRTASTVSSQTQIGDVELSLAFVRNEAIAMESPLNSITVKIIQDLKQEWNDSLCHSASTAEKASWNAYHKNFYHVKGCTGTFQLSPSEYDLHQRGELGARFQRNIAPGTWNFIEKVRKEITRLDEQEKAHIRQFVSDKGLDISKMITAEGDFHEPGIAKILQSIGILFSKEQLNDMGKKIAHTSKKVIDAKFPSTGFTDFAQFKVALDKNVNLAKLTSLLSSNSFKAVIRTPSNDVRQTLLKPGSSFKNQYQTGASSGGGNDLDYRFMVEQSRLNFSPDDFDSIPLSLRPKYGLLMTEEQLADDNSGSSQYGGDLWVFNLHKIKQCITWAGGDSLSAVGGILLTAASTLPDNWFYYFAPLDYVALSIPFLDGSSSTPNIKFSWNRNSALSGMNALPSRVSPNYLEVQIWCKINLDDVNSFVYTDKTLSRDEEAILRNKGIEIYDAMTPGDLKKK